MSLTSPNGKQTLATSTGELRLRYCNDANHPIADAVRSAMWEKGLDATKLFRIGPTTVHNDGDVTELRCLVDYGPVYGNCEWDLEKSLDSADYKLGEVAHFNWKSSVVRDWNRHRIADVAELRSIQAELSARLTDTTLSEDRRRTLLMRLEACAKYLAQHAQPISLVEEPPTAPPAPALPPAPTSPSTKVEPPTEVDVVAEPPKPIEQPWPSVVSPQALCWSPQSVDAKRVEDTSNSCTSSSAPDSIDLGKSLKTNDLQGDHHEEEREENANGPAKVPLIRSGPQANDIFRSSRDTDTGVDRDDEVR